MQVLQERNDEVFVVIRVVGASMREEEGAQWVLKALKLLKALDLTDKCQGGNVEGHTVE